MRRSYLLTATLALAMAALAGLASGQTVNNCSWLGGTGAWTATNWSAPCTGTFPNNTTSTVDDVTIDSASVDFVILNGGPFTVNGVTLGDSAGSEHVLRSGTFGVSPPSLGSLVINIGSTTGLTINTGSSLQAANGGTIELNVANASGSVLNNGQINVFGGGGQLLISDQGNAHSLTLNGSGVLTMDAGAVVQGLSGDELLVNNSTMEGAGVISNLAVVNTVDGNINVDAFSPLEMTPTAHNGAVIGMPGVQFGFANAGAVIVGTVPGDVFGLNATAFDAPGQPVMVQTGTITVNDGGGMEVAGLPGTTVILDNFAAGGGAGAINLSAATVATNLFFNGTNTTFDLTGAGLGTGTLTLSDNTNNAIVGVTGSETLIIDSGETLSGAGTISNLALVDNGAIISNATSPRNALLIKPNLNGGAVTVGSQTLAAGSFGFLNTALLQANTGTTLVLDTTASQSALLGSVVNYGTMTVSAFSELNLIAGAGQTVNVVNTNAAGGAGVLNFGGDQLLTGTNSTFSFVNGGSGSGTIALNGGVLQGDTATETIVLGAGETLTGSQSGIIRNAVLINDGNIVASGKGMSIASPAPTGFINNGTVEIQNQATHLSIFGNAANAGTIETLAGTGGTFGAFSDSGTFTNEAGAMLKLVNAGDSATLADLANGGAITAVPGAVVDVGTNSVAFSFFTTNGYQEVPNGTLDELISSNTSFGTIQVGGPAWLNGTLDVTLENGFVPAVGDEFAFLDFTPGGLNGAFATFGDQTFDNGLEKWELTYDNADGDVFLTAQSTAPASEPGTLLLLGPAMLALTVLMGRKKWERSRARTSS